VRLNYIIGGAAPVAIPVSIPQSEFCAFEPGDHVSSIQAVTSVSIPQSEFCAFERYQAARGDEDCIVVSIPQSEFCAFELTDSWWGNAEALQVSIPQSEFCAFERRQRLYHLGWQIMFQFPNRNSVRLNLNLIAINSTPVNSFNSPIGILCV